MRVFLSLVSSKAAAGQLPFVPRHQAQQKEHVEPITAADISWITRSS